jgi:hypothetical protein
MISPELKHRIETELPYDGEWWKWSTCETFLHLADTLAERGVEEEEIFDILHAAYTAVSAEYGR